MKHSIFCRVVLLALAVSLVGIAASADTLELKDGTVVHGKYIGGSEFNIRFIVNNKIEYYNTKDILTLSFDAGTSDAPKPATTTPASRPTTPTVAPGPSAVPRRSSSSSPTIPAGTVIAVRMIDGVDSTTNQVGDQFHASLESDIVVNGVVAAPKGADVYGRLATVKSAGSIQGQSQLELELTSIRINGNLLPVVSGDYDVAGKSRGKQSAERIGGVAALGAVIGAIAGGGKGAAIGAAAGAGAGTAVQVLTKGQQVKVPSETVLDFTLRAPIVVAAS
ncbi:MAG TPA: hypothetical protein VJN21_12080 [Candidatus Acidoferrales bacterium]|nr:hypothetical protein [Candidatus Acidoferrales bacterium]